MSRHLNRADDALRPIVIERGFMPYAEGSCLISFGNTKVICTASVDEHQPAWMRGQERGWVTAEYGMLPRATQERTSREVSRGKQGGRTHEIQRLIGRSLRAVVALEKLGQRTIWLDCDVIQADGGTRTAAITGSYVALVEACRVLEARGKLPVWPIREGVAAVSCGLVDGRPLLDLDYREDARCEVDMNFVMTASGRFVEIQGTAEGHPFAREEFDLMARLAEKGINELLALTGQPAPA